MNFRISEKTLILGGLTVCLVFFGYTARAQANETETAKRVEQTEKLLEPVEKYVAAIEAFIEKEDKPHLVVADVSDYNESEKPLWRKYDSEEDFEKARAANEAYTVAYIWRKAGRPVAVNLTLSSPSGDWAQFVLYIFRADGSLAKADSTLNTFYGDATVRRTYWFDEQGKLLKETVSYEDLESRKPFDPKSRDFFDQETELYKNAGQLPFAELLTRKPKSKKRNRLTQFF